MANIDLPDVGQLYIGSYGVGKMSEELFGSMG